MVTLASMNVDQLYRTEYAPLLRLAWSVTGSRRAAEDVVHDVFARLQRDWSDLAGHDNLPAWLRRSVLNRGVSRWRRLATEARHAASRSRNDESVVMPDYIGDVWAAVRRLPLRQRQVIALIYVDDRSPAEAAAVLGCSVETVRTHHRRALERLTHTLEEHR